MAEIQSGANIDLRSEAEKQKDWKFEEIVASANPVNWVEKTPDQWRKFPIFNQNGSGSCFPADAKVLMQDFSYKPISEIRVGDSVITHKGRIRKVTETFQRKWQGTTKKIKLWGDYEPIEATTEHPFFAIKRTERARGSERKEIDGTADFYKLGDLEKGDWVGLPLNNEIIRDTAIYDFENDPEFLWVLGLYLAEGSVGQYSVCFSLHKKETDFVERIKKAMSQYDTNITCSEKIEGLGMQANIQGQRWAKIFEELGRKYCDKKEINKRLMFLSPELQMNIVNGFFDGDGYDDDGRRIMVSTSLKLLTQIKIILLRNGIYSFLQHRREREDRKPVWVLEYSEASRYSFVKEKWCFVLIKDIEHSPAFYGGHVYNIEVNEDNSYILRGVAVHNCVAQTEAKELGMMRFLKDGNYVHFSATDIYFQRSNKPAGGMAAVDARNIIKNNGATLEVLVPSQNMNDAQMDAVVIEPYKREVGGVFKVPNYIELPAKDIETVASVIQTTGKGVMVWFYFKREEWTAHPIILDPNLKLEDLEANVRHSVTAVDFALVGGKKCLIIEDSWGTSFGVAGQRVIDEDFFKVRNWYAGYLVSFKFDTSSLPNKPQHTFLTDLEFGMVNGDVGALQDCLRFEGLFPINAQSTGYFGAITKKAVQGFQVKHAIVSAGGAGYGRVGPKTRAKLNELFG